MSNELDCNESKTLRWARYDEATRVLEIDFRGKDGSKQSTYRYENFPPEEWAQLNASTSRGGHFAAHIRTRYRGVKIWDARTAVK